MIPGSFYPTDVTTADQHLELTSRIADIPITSENFSDAYWLGWINYDNLPSAFRIYKYEIEDTVCTFTDVTAQKNYPVGYTCAYLTSTYMGVTRTGFDTNNGTKWERSTACSISGEASDVVRLPNNLDINTTAWNESIIIMLYGTASNGTATDNIMAAIATTDPTLTGNFQAYFGRKTGSFFNPTTLTLNFDDFSDGVFEFSRDGIDYKIAMTNYEVLYYRDIDTNNDSEYYAHPKPTILVEDDMEHQHLISSMTSPFLQKTTGYDWGSGQFYNGMYIESNGGLFNPNNGGCLFNVFDNQARGYGGLYGSFDLADVHFTTYEVYFPENANFMIVCIGRNDIGIILRYYKIDDIRKLLGLTARFSNTSTQRYENSSNYLYAHVSENNEFLCELVDGSPASVQNELREWQIVGHTIADNDFDPEDIPPYGPEPDDGPDSGGDDSRPWDFVNTPLSATNNFVTLYALSTAQVSEFGAVMWAKLSDTAFWQSVGTVFLNDFSINPADMLKYFVSLRYFPFDLTNYSSSYANGIYIGRSTYPIQISTYPRRMARNLVEISGGSAQVILPAPYDTQDFRNCDPNTQISVYVPYCGIVELSAAEVYGKTLDLRYYADMQTGALAASVCVRSDTYYEIATLAGSCGAEVPITANNNVEFLQRIATVASSGLGGTISGATNGAQIGGTPGAVAGGALGALTGSAQAMLALPPVTVHKAGKATGYATLGCDNRAHITIQVSKPSVPDSYAHTNGYVSNKQARIGDLSGYTEMINPDTSGIDAHADELEKIKAILQSGFYA